MQHRYLLTLEVVPLGVGKTYPELPSHLTLMSRFLSDLSATEISDVIRPVLQDHRVLQLHFAGLAQLGPKKLTVHMVEESEELKALHGSLLTELRKLSITFEYPQFIGTGHKPHVTQRENYSFTAGDIVASSAVYLIEVVDSERVVRKKFALRDSELRKNKNQT